MRPPSPYWVTCNTATEYDAEFPSGKSVACLGPNHHLSGVEVEGEGVLAGTCSSAPPGRAAAFTRDVTAGWYEIVPGTIDTTTTTCWPITFHYGPLALGSR